MSRMTLMMVRTDITLGRKVVMISKMALVMGRAFLSIERIA